MASASVSGIDLFYELSGHGPRLLLLNGSGATYATSGPLVTRLARDFEVLAFDQRGLGQSGAVDGPYAMADLASDALGLVDHVGWDRCRVLGISFGGMVAQELVAAVPERCQRLALVCTSSGGAGGSSYPLHTLGDLEPQERAARLVTVLDTRFTPAWLATHDADRAWVAMMGERRGAEQTPEVRHGERRQLEARSHFDAYDRLPRITCPTLVASGRFDGVAPPQNGAAIAAQIPGAELRLYQGGHLFFFQDPTAFPEIVDFLKG